MDNYYGNICYCRRCNGVVHTIKKGDTLYLISKYYKVPIGEIMNANRNLNIYNLQIGDEICIPVRRPEPRENGMTADQMPLQMPMGEPEAYVPNNVSPMGETIGNMGSMEKMDDISTMSAEESSPQKSSEGSLKLSDVLSREDMTFDEFVKLVRNFDN